MTNPDYRAMCAELVDVFDNPSPPQYKADVLARARALLAQPEPQPPADGEAAELAAELRHFIAGYQQMRGLDPEHVYSIHRGDAMEAHLRISRLLRIAELLERLASDNAGLTAAADTLWADNVSLLDN